MNVNSREVTRNVLLGCTQLILINSRKSFIERTSSRVPWLSQTPLKHLWKQHPGIQQHQCVNGARAVCNSQPAVQSACGKLLNVSSALPRYHLTDELEVHQWPGINNENRKIRVVRVTLSIPTPPPLQHSQDTHNLPEKLLTAAKLPVRLFISLQALTSD